MKFMKSVKSRMMAAGAALAAMAGVASAQTPTLDTIDFPIDVASIGAALGAAGAVVLLIVFGYKGGFKLVWSVFQRVLKFI